MEYTVSQLAELAGVSARTLRYYDAIGLLSPVRVTPAGYRIYGRDEVDRLQQILFYRELEISLEDIARIITDEDFDRKTALRGHARRLVEKRARIDALIQTIGRTLADLEGGQTMQDNEKFAGFKRERIARNEQRYGGEIRQKYGDEAIDAANAKLLNMNAEQYDVMERCKQQVLELLDKLAKSGEEATGEVARALATTHKKWLCCHWANYTPQAHIALADMYVSDERFAAYYDRGTPGKAALLREAITQWAHKL